MIIYYFKNQSAPKKFCVLKVHSKFKNIKEGNITLEKAAEEQKEFKSEINKMVKGSKKPK